MANWAFLSLLAATLPVAAWAQGTMPAASSGLEAGQAASSGVVAAAPTAAEAEAAFQAAREAYRVVAAGGPGQYAQDLEQIVTPTTVMVPGGRPENVGLEEIRLVLDVENATLRQVVADVVRQAAHYSGPWRVKWRLKPENMGLLDEKVNLTAEAPFGEFFGLLAERVKNLTGTQLFITVFGGARVILVADTYY